MAESIQFGAMDAQLVADLLGVTTRQLSNYIKTRDLPSHGEGRQRTFIWKEVLAWWYDYKRSLDKYAGSPGSQSDDSNEDTSVPDLKHSEARKAKFIADMREIDLQKKRGELVAMADVARILGETATGLQNEILGFPTRIVEQVLVLRERVDLFHFLTSEAAGLCTRLSTLRIGTAEELAEPAVVPEQAEPEDDEDE